VSKRYKIGVWLQEYESAKRNVKGIKRDIVKGKLPKSHPALKKNKERLKRAKKELQKLGVKVKK